MTRLFLLVSLFFLLVSCGAERIPAWKQNAAADMNGFVQSSFTGNESYAAKYFDRMVEDFRMTVDPDEIVKAHLTRCVVQFALLEYQDCADVAELLPMLKNRENVKYYNFVTGKGGSPDNIPEKYGNISAFAQKCDTKKANSELSSEKDPSTLLVKASFLFKSGCYNAETAGIAVDTASKEGWKKAALKYLALQFAYYEKHGEQRKAELVKKRMELVISE